MRANAIIRARVDEDRKMKAEAVLGRLGLSIGEAVEMLIDRIADDGDLPLGLEPDRPEHDAWIAAEVRKALADMREPIPDEEMKLHFARRRDAATPRNDAASATRHEARMVSLGAARP